jgi:hypothetical protein
MHRGSGECRAVGVAGAAEAAEQQRQQSSRVGGTALVSNSARSLPVTLSHLIPRKSPLTA